MIDYSLIDYLKDLVIDAKFEVGQHYDTNDVTTMPTPYANIVNYYDIQSSYKIRFPNRTTEVDRPTQYYMLSRFISQLDVSRLGIVAVLKIQIPSRPEIPQKYWDRECSALLIGVSSKETYGNSVPYETSIVLFDHFDGKLEFFDITDINVWEEFIDNTSIFRDFLIFATMDEPEGAFDIAIMYLMLTSFGFHFDLTDEEKINLFVSQPDFILAPGAILADL